MIETPPVDLPMAPLFGLDVYPLREAIDREFHARPPDLVQAPLRVMHLVMVITPEERERTRAHFVELCEHFGHALPSAKQASFALHPASDDKLLIKWEQHLEFASYTFFYNDVFCDPFEDVFESRVPRDWLAAIPGKLLVATRLALEPKTARERAHHELIDLFQTPYLIGANALDGHASVFSNFLASPQGFSKILVRDNHMTGHQAGRLVRRLLDIETYRAMAILGFPQMRELTEKLGRMELQLGDLMDQLSHESNPEHEQIILNELMELASLAEKTVASFAYRFSAGHAYHALVTRCVNELREARIEGLPMVHEFLQRRFDPALRTIEAAYSRQERLSQRVARAANLLRTQVDLELARQNRDLLASMNRRVQLQFRLQEMVEGLSVFVLGYYIVNLIGYGYKALYKTGVPLDTDVAIAVTIPVVLAGIWAVVKWRKKHLLRDVPKDHQ
ncbi:MAG: DUF3422 domain-containing protein [Burkholderiales bacterium]|jgi:uncharacterized membrane-anchored protein|nr:DUF3422 domain-containing protein [Burkholderiales bacterium]